jgi:hypothetical protein
MRGVQTTTPDETATAQSDRRMAYALLRATIGVNLAVHGISGLLPRCLRRR